MSASKHHRSPREQTAPHFPPSYPLQASTRTKDLPTRRICKNNHCEHDTCSIIGRVHDEWSEQGYDDWFELRSNITWGVNDKDDKKIIQKIRKPPLDITRHGDWISHECSPERAAIDLLDKALSTFSISGVYIRPIPSGKPNRREKVNERNTTTPWDEFVRANHLSTKSNGRTTPTQESHLAFSRWEKTRKGVNKAAAKVKAEEAARRKMVERSPPQKGRKVNERNTKTAWCKYIRATALTRKVGRAQSKGRDSVLLGEPTPTTKESSGRTTPTPESYRAFVGWKAWRQRSKEWADSKS